jgi:anti-sigma regulatory factor (Ser/Thr protein kinase)
MVRRTGSPARCSTHPLDGRSGTITLARQYAQEFFGLCEPPLPPSAMEDALLLVSELVTNAVRHAPGPCVLTLADWRPGLTVAVSDTSSAQPVARPPDLSTGSGGFGWHLLHRIARQVEVRPDPAGGKTVTAALERDLD